MSNVWFESREIRLYDKELCTPEMRYIDYGIAVLSATVFTADSRQRGIRSGLCCTCALCQEKQMAAYEVKQRFYEIGSAQGTCGT